MLRWSQCRRSHGGGAIAVENLAKIAALTLIDSSCFHLLVVLFVPFRSTSTSSVDQVRFKRSLWLLKRRRRKCDIENRLWVGSSIAVTIDSVAVVQCCMEERVVDWYMCSGRGPIDAKMVGYWPRQEQHNWEEKGVATVVDGPDYSQVWTVHYSLAVSGWSRHQSQFFLFFTFSTSVLCSWPRIPRLLQEVVNCSKLSIIDAAELKC